MLCEPAYLGVYRDPFLSDSLAKINIDYSIVPLIEKTFPIEKYKLSET